MEQKIDDNLIASFIDDKLTPLARLVYSDSMKDSMIEEIIEVTKDAKSLESKLCDLDPIQIPECERYLEKIYNQEISSNIEN